MTKPTNTTPRPKRDRHLAWVNAYDLQVNPVAQREFRPAWAAKILSEWDIEKFQEPHVNNRADGSLFIMEGQHGTWAYREKYGEEGQNFLPIQVWLYDALTEKQEADTFLSLNNKKAIDPMAKFKAAVTANRDMEADIDRIVRANKCVVTNNTGTNNAIAAVTALTSIYSARGANNLAATIQTLRDAFGHGGFERAHLLAVSMVVARYNLQTGDVVPALLKMRRGSKGLVQDANKVRANLTCTLNEATASAIVDAINKGRRTNKLPHWFASEMAA